MKVPTLALLLILASLPGFAYATSAWAVVAATACSTTNRQPNLRPSARTSVEPSGPRARLMCDLRASADVEPTAVAQAWPRRLRLAKQNWEIACPGAGRAHTAPCRCRPAVSSDRAEIRTTRH